MSILIKGMEMPTSCDDCFLPLRYCPYAMKPNGKCPIVPVPPHGRLIDADALLEHMMKIHDKWKMEGHYTPTTDDEIMTINMPTIIEAEGEE